MSSYGDLLDPIYLKNRFGLEYDDVWSTSYQVFHVRSKVVIMKCLAFDASIKISPSLDSRVTYSYSVESIHFALLPNLSFI